MTCPLCHTDFRADGSCDCPPEMAGAGRRVLEVRRGETEPVVVVTYTGHGSRRWDRLDIRFTPLVDAGESIERALGCDDFELAALRMMHALAVDDAQDGQR